MENAYETYKPGGVPTLVPSAVLFLDILGTATFRDEDEAQAYLRQTHDAFAQARERGDSRRGASEITVATWFSDNLVMSMPLAGLLEPGHVVDFLAMYAAFHQLVLGQAGLFARGAITFGLFYADEEFVNGPALNEAYTLESQAANYPRVILAPAAMHALIEAEDREGLDPQICAGDDGVPFVDYLRYITYTTPDQGIGDELERHRDQIREHLDRYAGNVRIEQKYSWLASYHDARAPSDLRVRPGEQAADFRILDPPRA